LKEKIPRFLGLVPDIFHETIRENDHFLREPPEVYNF
jgi:hypothetical protein